MQFSPKIFRAYDIRGVYERDFDAEFAYVLGQAFVKHVDARKILVGHDSRASSPELAKFLIKGLTAMGADVYYLGAVSTPFLNFVFNHLNMEAGVNVTASHNEPEFAGFKLYDKMGDISGMRGLPEIQKIIFDGAGILPLKEEKGGHRSEGIAGLSKYGGRINNLKIDLLLEDYADRIVDLSGVKKDDLSSLKVYFKTTSIVQRELREIFDRVNVKQVIENYDVMFSFDEDEDRIYVRDKEGKEVPADYIAALLIDEKVRLFKKPLIICDLLFSRGVMDYLNKRKIRTLTSPVGRSYVNALMRKHNADMGAELSGHIYFKEANYHELTPLTALRILRLMVRNNRSLADLVKPFATWFRTKDIKLDLPGLSDVFQSLVTKVKSMYPEEKFDLLDGISVLSRDWWFNIRPSNTEPILRLVIEGRTLEIMDLKKREVLSLISEKQ